MSTVFDVLLIATLLVVAAGALAEDKLFKSVVMFVVFGLFLAIAWVRLDAPDVALAEGAIGAGVTGALMLDAIGHVRRGRTTRPTEPSGEADDV